MSVERLPLCGGRECVVTVWHESQAAASASAAPVQYHAIVVPGNPGISGFYLPFAAALHAKLGGAVSVRCINLAGFTAEEYERKEKVGAAAENKLAQGTVASGSPPSPFSLPAQCSFVHDYLHSLHLHLQAADEVARGEPQPPHLSPGLVSPLRSPHLRSASTSCARPPKREHRFILICHSIGAYIGLDVMRREEEDKRAWEEEQQRRASFSSSFPTSLSLLSAYLSSSPSSSSPSLLPPISISHSFLLFPFIRMDVPRFQFRLFRLLLSSPLRPLLRLLVRLWSLLPTAVFRVVLRLAAGITAPYAVKAVVDTYTNINLVEACVQFAASEFKEVRKEGPTRDQASSSSSSPSPFFHPSFLSRHVSRTTLYYAGKEHDMWGPLSQMDSFKQQIPGVDCRVVPSAVHAWCAYPEQTETMATLVSRDLEQLFARWSSQVAQPVESTEVKNSAPSATTATEDATDLVVESTPLPSRL